MSLYKIIELSTRIQSIRPSPEILAMQKAYEKIAPVLRLNEKMHLMAKPLHSLNLEHVLRQLEAGKVLLKDSALRHALEGFTADEVEHFEYLEDEEGQPQPSNIIVDEAQQMRQLITDIYNNNNTLYVLTGRRFEELIAELMASQGFEVELTQQTRDGGYDILAVQKLLGQYALRFLVECKKYDSSRKVGVEVVRSFSHVLSRNGANKGILVTTSYFTKDALSEAQHPYLLDFRDKDKVLEWVRAYLKK